MAMVTKGELMGIEVRANGPGPHALHDRAREVLTEIFNRIFTLSQQLHEKPLSPTLDFESTLERTELHARLQGLVMRFAEMLRLYDPLIPSVQALVWNEGPSAGRLFSLIFHQWSFNLRPLPASENNDHTWGLFFAAVDAAEREDHGTAFERIAELKKQAPESARYWDWYWRVHYYAQSVAPEYRRWFTRIEGEITLPRI